MKWTKSGKAKRSIRPPGSTKPELRLAYAADGQQGPATTHS